MAGTSEHTEVNTPVGFFPTILAKLEDMLNIIAAVTIFAVMGHWSRAGQITW